MTVKSSGDNMRVTSPAPTLSLLPRGEGGNNPNLTSFRKQGAGGEQSARRSAWALQFGACRDMLARSGSPVARIRAKRAAEGRA